MVECKNVSFSYRTQKETDAKTQSQGCLENINLSIKAGSFILLCGASGCGKTTITRLINGVIPHYYEGNLQGTVTLDKEEYKEMSLFDISKKVGSVFQNPRSQFYNVDTTGEIAFGCENQGMSETLIYNRVQKVSKLLNLSKLLDRSIFSLSGGEKQKIACGSAACIEPEVIVLDEPSSNLDAYAILELKEMLRVLKNAGKTIIIAEHRLYYLCDLADQIICLKNGEIYGTYTPQEFRVLEEKKKENLGLRPVDLTKLLERSITNKRKINDWWTMKKFYFSYKRNEDTLHIDELKFPHGNITAIIGHNGAGKTTFSRCFCGLEKRCKGTIQKEEKIFEGKRRLKLCYMVMQDVNHQLFTESVMDEILLSLDEEDEVKAEKILEKLDLCEYKDAHPMALSGGQKQRVAIASAVASGRPFILFDEPTSGLDLFHMHQVAEQLNKLADMGKTLLVVTHDPEFILQCCDYVIHLEEGRAVEHYALDNREKREKLLKFFLVDRLEG